MADSCAQLSAEIAALRSAIAAMDGKFVRRPELPALRAEILGAIPALLGAYATKDQIAGLASKSELSKFLTKADGGAIADAARAGLERSFALKSDLPPLERQAREAIEKAGSAASKADGAKSVADRALGAINKVEGAIDKLEGKLQDAVGKAAKALGASESALAKAGNALSRAGDAASRVASLAGAVAGILALIGTFVSFSQLNALERRIDALGAELSKVFSSLQLLKNRLESKLDEALSIAKYAYQGVRNLESGYNNVVKALKEAMDLAVRSMGEALLAQELARGVHARAVSAEKVAAGAKADAAINAAAIAGIAGSIGAIGSVAGNALSRAGQAQNTAGRALAQAGRPGRDGRDGRPGRDGKDAAQLTPAALIPMLTQALPQAVQQQAARIRPIIVNAGQVNVMNPADTALLRRIDATTRANLATSRGNAGLITRVSGVLGTVKTSIDKIIKSQIADKIMLAMTYFTVLHNAYFLSSNLTQTLFSVSSNGINAALRLIGMQSANDEQIDVGKMVSQSFDNAAKTAFGVQTWEGIKTQWKAYSRVYQATANLLFTVQGLLDAARSISELAAENTGRIGNALKKWGIVGEGAYRWMPENVNHTSAFQRKWEKVAETGEGIEQAASVLDSVAGSTVSVLDGITEFNNNKKEFDKAVKEAAPKERPENEPVKATTDASKEASQPPAINPSDLVKPGA